MTRNQRFFKRGTSKVYRDKVKGHINAVHHMLLLLKIGCLRLPPLKSNGWIPKMMGFGKCISGFKYGVILGIHVSFRGCIFFVVVKTRGSNNFAEVASSGQVLGFEDITWT